MELHNSFIRLYPGAVPAGTILWLRDYGKAAEQSQVWARCDGRELSIAQYPDLFEVIGHRYGREPEVLHVRQQAPLWKRLFGIQTHVVEVLNPRYRPGVFRLPDIRNGALPLACQNGSESNGN